MTHVPLFGQATFPDLGNGLQKLLDMVPDDVESLGSCFEVVSSSEFGEIRTVELKPGGKDILVTAANREGLSLFPLSSSSSPSPFLAFSVSFSLYARMLKS